MECWQTNSLKKNIDYRGFDIIKRRDYITQFDLHVENPIPSRHKNDVLIFLGVLEYLDNPLHFIKNWVLNYNTSIFTYNVVSNQSSDCLLTQVYSEDLRSTLGWSNSLTLSQIKALLISNGLHIKHVSQTKYNEENRFYTEYIFVVSK